MSIIRRELPSESLGNAVLANTICLTLQNFQKKHQLDDAERGILERGRIFFKRAAEGQRAFEKRLMGGPAVENSAIYGTLLEVLDELKPEPADAHKRSLAKKGAKPSSGVSEIEPEKFIRRCVTIFKDLVAGKEVPMDDVSLLIAFFKALRTSAFSILQLEQPYERVHIGFRSR